MSYCLNTSVSTRKVTLASTGPYSGPIYNPRYILSRPLLFDDRLMHICGVETVVMKHPTYFHERYLEGTGNYVKTDGTVSEVVTFGPENFNAYLNGIYAQPRYLSIGLIDNVLWSLFKFLQAIIQDDGTNLFFMFNGFASFSDYFYNGKAWDDTTTCNLNNVADNIQVRNHVAILTALYQSSNFQFSIVLKGGAFSAIHLEGPMLNLFGIDSNRKMIISNGVPFDVQLPMFGHDYISIGSNVCSNIQTMQAGSKIEATSLLTIMPLIKYCGYTESYSPPSASGRTEIVSNTIDCIELSFTDKFGNPILSLENFVITLLFDDVKPEELPKPHHTSLFKIRKGDMQSQRDEATQDISKKLRSSYIY